MPRAARDIIPIAAVGGYMSVYRYEGLRGNEGGIEPAVIDHAFAGNLLEVGKWSIRHKFNWAEITHSGSSGEILRALVSQDFEFDCELPWNAREEPDRVNEAVGFLQEIMMGNPSADYNVSILFVLGDPLHYPDVGGIPGVDRRASLWAPKVALEEVYTVTDSTGKEVVRIDCRGRGNSLLRGLRGLDVKFNATEQTDPAFTIPPAPPPVKNKDLLPT